MNSWIPIKELIVGSTYMLLPTGSPSLKYRGAVDMRTHRKGAEQPAPRLIHVLTICL